MASLKKHFLSVESLAGSGIGAFCGAIRADRNHYPDFVEKWDATQGFIEHVGLRFQNYYNSLDELIIGATVGCLVGMGINYYRKRRNQNLPQ